MQPLLILICLIGPLSVSGRSCNYLYIPGDYNWKDARDRCKNDGMDLAVIKDKETLEEVNDYVTTIEWTNDIWIGLIWNTIDSSFEWIDNETLRLSTHWAPGNPNCMEKGGFYCSNFENCVRIQETSLWNTKECDKEYSMLCQRCTATTRLPTTFYSQTTNHTDLETTTHSATNTSVKLSATHPATNTSITLTATHPTINTSVTLTATHPTTNTSVTLTATHPTTNTSVTLTATHPATNTSVTLSATHPATNTSVTLTSLECEEWWMNQCKCNCQESSVIPEISNDIITYRLDKTTLSSYTRKRSSASDPRKSSFYIGCVGIIVLVLSVLFIVVLDFIPRE